MVAWAHSQEEQSSVEPRGGAARRRRTFWWPGEARMLAQESTKEVKRAVRRHTLNKPSLDGTDVPTMAKRAEKFLRPLASRPTRKRVVVYDYESKDDESDRPGWTRPFLLALYDGQEVRFFENDPAARPLPWRLRHLERDLGLTDIFLRHLFGDFPGATEEDRVRYQSETTLIYAHNGGKFDHLFVLGWLRRNRDRYTFEIASVQARIQRLDVWPRGKQKENGFWSFLDSISLLPMSLEKMGETFCKGLFEKVKWSLSTDERHPFWKWYCGQDAVVAYRGLMAFHKLIEGLGGDVGLTAPSTAMNLYRRRFLPREGWIERSAHFPGCSGVCQGCDRRECNGECHGCAHAFVRQGYYGGRTEVWERQSGRDLLYYDLNSSYPASMMMPMPAGAMIVPQTRSVEWFRELRRTHIGFVEADIFIPQDCKLPCLPFRHPEGKLVFPTGRPNPAAGGIPFTGVWDWDELQLLKHPLVKGKIVRIHRSVWFKQRPIFRNFITTLYGLRQRSKKDSPGLAETCKLMMNSAYGKFGMNPERTGLLMVTEGDPIPDNAIPIDGKHEQANGDTSIFWQIDRYVEAAYIVPQIAAHVTALSRIRLFHGMADVIMRGGSLYYTDTDSCMVNLALSKHLLDDDKLGFWKREEPGALLSGHFVRPKLYMLTAHKESCADDGCEGCFRKWHLPDCGGKAAGCLGCTAHKPRMKGVGSRVATPETFAALLRGEPVKFDRVMQHKSMLKHADGETVMALKLSYDEWGSLLSDTRAHKSVKTPYDKRVLDERTGKTTPMWLG